MRYQSTAESRTHARITTPGASVAGGLSVEGWAPSYLSPSAASPSLLHRAEQNRQGPAPLPCGATKGKRTHWGERESAPQPVARGWGWGGRRLVCRGAGPWQVHGRQAPPPLLYEGRCPCGRFRCFSASNLAPFSTALLSIVRWAVGERKKKRWRFSHFLSLGAEEIDQRSNGGRSGMGADRG